MKTENRKWESVVFLLCCVCGCVSFSATVVEVQASVPPTMEAMTIPRTTQHIIIIIFFCKVLTITDKQSSVAANGEQRKTCQKYDLYFTSTHVTIFIIIRTEGSLEDKQCSLEKDYLFLMYRMMLLECVCGLEVFSHPLL